MLKGLVALVTGSASGLGKAVAANFINKGVYVVGIDNQHGDECSLDPKEFTETENCSILRGVELNNCVLQNGDVCSSCDVEKALQTIGKKWGKLDVVVNCAAISDVFLTYNLKTSHMLDEFLFDNIVKNNVIGTFNVIRLSAALMAKNKTDSGGSRGVIINTSASAASDGYSGQSSYSASMSAIAHMTLPISRDLSTCGVRVVTISPGLFNTPFLGDPPADVCDLLRGLNVFPHRLGNGGDFSQCVETIIGNPMINGEVIKLNAGFRMPHIV